MQQWEICVTCFVVDLYCDGTCWMNNDRGGGLQEMKNDGVAVRMEESVVELITAHRDSAPHIGVKLSPPPSPLCLQLRP